MKIKVIQSHKKDVPEWIALCIASVKGWSDLKGYDYEFKGDEFLAIPPSWAIEKCKGNVFALTDVSRLIWMGALLQQGYDRVVWVDSDVVMFDPDNIHIEGVEDHGFSHEGIISYTRDKNRKVKYLYREGINNAIMFFDKESPVLKEYLEKTLDVLKTLDRVPKRTELGPALLHEWHKERKFNVLKDFDIMFPELLRQSREGGPIIETYRANAPICKGANMCGHMSMIEATNELLLQEVSLLLKTKGKSLQEGSC